MTPTCTALARNLEKRLGARNHITAAHSRCRPRIRHDQDRTNARRDEVLAKWYIHAGHSHRKLVALATHSPTDRA